MAAPEITNLDGGYTYRSRSGTHFIDQGADAVVTDGDNDIARLDVYFSSGDGSIGIHTEAGKISLSADLNPGSIISFGTTEIGRIEDGSDPSYLGIAFNDDVTSAQVQELIRALTYTNAATNEFSDSGAITLLLLDKADAAATASVNIADKVSGTDDGDVFSAENELIDWGDELDGGAGDDVFTLTGGGAFGLHRMERIDNIETIRGSAATDSITIKSLHLSGIRSIESGGTGTGDKLIVTGADINLSNTDVVGFQEIRLADNGAIITLDDVETARLVTGYETTGDTLRLTSGTLTEQERLILHRQGIDTIIAKDANGQEISTTHGAPQIEAFDGATVKASIGTSVFLDAGQDAILTVDSGILKSLSVHVSGIDDPAERLGIHTGSGVTLGPTGAYFRNVSVDGVLIGGMAGTPQIHGLSFSFNEHATTERVQKLIRALTYTKTSGVDEAPRTVEFALRDVGGRETSGAVTIELPPNAAPTNIGLSRTSVREASPTGTLIGSLSATDTPGSTFTYSLVGDAGGRFRISGNQLKVNTGILLDYEQARSHTIRVKVTDQGGLSYQESLTISVDDVSRETTTGTVRNDTFRGGSSTDKLDGGYGNDRLTGGKGQDTFMFKTALSRTGNVDTITDFSPKDDRIQLENKIFRKLAKTGVLTKEFFTIGSKAKEKDDYVVYDRTKGYLYYDADGSGKGKAVLFAKLKAGIDHKDFYVI